MKLEDITPLVLTYNEEPNIRRCLERLDWASRVVVLDSGSKDATEEICASFSNVDWNVRAFDSFAEQCNAGLRLVDSEWVLSIDADYLIPSAFPTWAEQVSSGLSGYSFSFHYCVFGRRLRSCLYPPRTVLYKKAFANYENDGHGHRVQISGEVEDSGLVIDHDDRKPLERWLLSQQSYALLEAEKLEKEENPSGLPDRIRKKIWIAAPLMLVYTLFVKRAIFDGWAGWFYALQRSYAELLLSLVLLERKLLGGEIGK